MAAVRKTDTHQQYHTSDGEWVVGTTTALNMYGGDKVDNLMRWGVRLANQGQNPFAVRDRSAEIGTVAHAMIEEHILEILGQPTEVFDRDEYAPDIIEVAEKAVSRFSDWERVYAVEYLEAEIQLASDKYHYGGTIDIVAMVDGELAIIDLKTSNGVYASHRMQIAAYRYLYYENFAEWGNPWILHLDKKTGHVQDYQIPIHKIKPCFTSFLNCVENYYLKDKI